jgi:hypothetical protein
MSERSPLPNRRPSENFDMEFSGLKYKITISKFPDGRLLECFVSNHKAGNASDVAARDAGILLSLALQYGCPAKVIASAVSRNSDGSASGVIGAVLDLITKEHNDHDHQQQHPSPTRPPGTG